MDPATIATALSLLQSGKLDGLLGQFPLLGQLKGLAGPPESQPAQNVAGALVILIAHAPEVSASELGDYVQAISQAIIGGVTLRRLAKP